MKQLKNSHVFFLFLVLGLLLYGNTLGHDFALDDAIVITDNEFTKKGFAGIWDQLTNDQFVGFYGEKKELVSGGRYRPLSMVVFNIQYAFAGESPFLGHLTNVLFYILNGFLLFLLLDRLLLNYQALNKWLSFPLLVSLLWFFHPIHTEVVANVKGLDEIMAFCFEIMTVWFLLNYLDHQKIKHLLFAGILFFLALLSKENAITWLAVIPLLFYFFTKHSIKRALPTYLTLIIAAVIWFAARYEVVGGSISNVADNLMNDPFLESTNSEKYATIVLTLGKYLQLLVFPHPLTYDYYPKHIPIVNWNNSLVMLTILAYAVLFITAIWAFTKKHIIGFGIAIFVITLSIASNIVFPIGAFMNERFIYVSSLGFAILLAYFLTHGLKILFSGKTNQIGMVLLGITLLLYSAKTISRNRVWKNNLALATHDANVSVNGAKSNIMAGGLLTENAAKLTNTVEKKQMLQEGIFYLNRTINIYPEYIDALLLMGNAQWQLTNNINDAMPYYYKVLAINPNHQNTWQNCFIILEQSKNVDAKIQAYKTLQRYNPNKPTLYLNLGRALGREKNDLAGAQTYLEMGKQIAPNNYDILTNLGTLYGLQQNYSAAIEVLSKALQLQPKVAKTHVDLGLSYYYSGQLEQAKTMFDKAVELDNSINRSQFPT